MGGISGSQNKLDVHFLENIITISNRNAPVIFFVRHFTFKLLLACLSKLGLVKQTIKYHGRFSMFRIGPV